MLSLIAVNEGEKWDEIVTSFKNFDVYYLSGYTKAFQLHGDGEPTLFYYEDQNIRAINVVMLRDIANDVKFEGKLPSNTFFDMSTPYGYGGFLIEGTITEESIMNLNDQYTLICQEKGIVSEFVRFHPVLNNYQGLDGMYNIKELGKTITIKLNSVEQIWSDITSKNRNTIRKARKSGVEIYWGRDNKLLEIFKDLYISTMNRDYADDYYYFNEDFYKSILNDLKYNSMIFYAMFEGKIIAMSIILFSNQQIHYHLSASDMEYKNLAPTNLLLFEAACWGCANGYKSFHLGGGLGSKEDSLYKFKKAFNDSSDTTFSIGNKVFDEDLYFELVQIRGGVVTENDSNFFPLYRVEEKVYSKQ